MENNFLITTDKSYHEAMIAIYELMNSGEANLSMEKIEQLKIMNWLLNDMKIGFCISMGKIKIVTGSYLAHA